MVLRKIFLAFVIQFMVFSGIEDFLNFPFYFITTPYGSLLFPETGNTHIYLDEYILPEPAFDVYPQLPPVIFPREKEDSLYFRSVFEGKELFVGSREDFGIRIRKKTYFLQAISSKEREGREYSLIGIKNWRKSFFYINYQKNYSYFTNMWRNAIFTTFQHKRKNFQFLSFLKYYMHESEKDKLDFYSLSVAANYSKELNNFFSFDFEEKLEAARGSYSWKTDRIIYLDETPLMKVVYAGFDYSPLKSDTYLFIKYKKYNLSLHAGGILTYINGGLTLGPYLGFSAGKDGNEISLSYKNVSPRLEGLYGLNRNDNPEKFYSWNNNWVEVGTGDIKTWEGSPGPYHRFIARAKVQRNMSKFVFRAGAFYVRDWNIPEDTGIWQEETSTYVSFKGAKFPIWIEDKLEKYEYRNFSELWRERFGFFTGGDLKSSHFSFSGYISYKKGRGTYPFSPIFYYPGDLCLYSSSIMNQKNTDPNFVEQLKQNYQWGDGFSLFVSGNYQGKGTYLGGYFYLFKNPSEYSFLMITGLPQPSFYLPIADPKEGTWNFISGIIFKVKVKNATIILESDNLFRKNVVSRILVDENEKNLFLLPPERILVGILFQ